MVEVINDNEFGELNTDAKLLRKTFIDGGSVPLPAEIVSVSKPKILNDSKSKADGVIYINLSFDGVKGKIYELDEEGMRKTHENDLGDTVPNIIDGELDSALIKIKFATDDKPIEDFESNIESISLGSFSTNYGLVRGLFILNDLIDKNSKKGKLVFTADEIISCISTPVAITIDEREFNKNKYSSVSVDIDASTNLL